MISSARILGAPVTEPGGNVARTRSAADVPGRRRALDRRHQMVHAGMRLEREQLPRGHRAVARHAAEVVAREVDDHHVLGHVLRAGAQRERQAAVLGRIRVARARALDRTRLDAVATAAQEALRRRRDHVRPAEPHERRERRRARRAQAAVERERIAVPVRRQPLGEVDLEHVARADVVDRARAPRARSRVAAVSSRHAPTGSCAVPLATRRAAPRSDGPHRRRRAPAPRAARGRTRATPRSARAPAAAGRGRPRPATGSASISRPEVVGEPAGPPALAEPLKRRDAVGGHLARAARRGYERRPESPNPGMLSSSTRPGSCRRASAAAKGSAQESGIVRMVNGGLVGPRERGSIATG